MKNILSRVFAAALSKRSLELSRGFGFMRALVIVAALAMGGLTWSGCKKSDTSESSDGNVTNTTGDVGGSSTSAPTPAPTLPKNDSPVAPEKKPESRKTPDPRKPAPKKDEPIAKSSSANKKTNSTSDNQRFEYDHDALVEKCRKAGIPAPPNLSDLKPDLAALIHDQAIKACDGGSAEDIGRLGSMYLAISTSREDSDRAVNCYSKAKELAPDDHRWPYMLARLFLKRDSAVRGRLELERTVELNPDYAMGYGWLGNLCLSQENGKEAKEFFDKFIGLRPEDAFGYCGRGAALLIQGELETAKLDLDKAIELDPTMGWAFALTSRYHEGKGESVEAKQAMRKASTLPIRPGMLLRDPLAVERWRCLGATETALLELAALAQARDLPSAQKLSEILLSDHSDNPVLILGLSRFELIQGKYEEALKLAIRARGQDPNSADVHETIARCYIKLGNLDEALAAAEKAVEANDRVDYAHRVKGEVLLAMNRLDDAKASFTRDRELNPGRPQTAQMIANIWFMQEDYEKAREFFEKAILAANVGNYPITTYGPLFAGLGEVDLREEKMDLAVTHFGQAIASDPGYVDSFMSLASALIDEGRGDEALAFCDKILSERPEFAVYKLMRVEILDMLGRSDEALRAIQELVKFSPNAPNTFLVAGRVFNNNKYTEQADLSFKRAVELAPRLEKAQVAHVEFLLSQGNGKEALAAAEEGLEYLPESVRLANTVSWFRGTISDESLRDPEKAVKWGEFVCERTERKLASCLDTLACAYASAGRFEDAANTVQEAIDIAKTDPRLSEELTNYESRLELFKSQKPYIDTDH